MKKKNQKFERMMKHQEIQGYIGPKEYVIKHK